MDLLRCIAREGHPDNLITAELVRAGNDVGKPHRKGEPGVRVVDGIAAGAGVERGIDVALTGLIRADSTDGCLADLIRLHSIVQGNHHGIAIKLGTLDKASRDAAEPSIELAKGVVQKEHVEELGSTSAVAGIVAEQLGVLEVFTFDRAIGIIRTVTSGQQRRGDSGEAVTLFGDRLG